MSKTDNPVPGVIENYLDALWMEKGLSENTLAAYRRDLLSFSRWCDAKPLSLLAVSRGDLQGYLATLLAHNLNRELQMRCHPMVRKTTDQRSPLWKFVQLGTLRKKIIQRAGRLTKPGGKLTLTMGANDAVKAELLRYLRCLEAEA